MQLCVTSWRLNRASQNEHNYVRLYSYLMYVTYVYLCNYLSNLLILYNDGGWVHTRLELWLRRNEEKPQEKWIIISNVQFVMKFGHQKQARWFQCSMSLMELLAHTFIPYSINSKVPPSNAHLGRLGKYKAELDPFWGCASLQASVIHS
jgi:hypothetical protein